MSGIAGIVRFDGGPAERRRVEAMTAAMDFRGPDGIAHWSEGPAALGHMMLHTTPESLHEHQPLASTDGRRVLVMDGRIDNRDELAEALSARGVRPVDDSDAAMALAAYETWGDDCPERIVGDFALVIWDAPRRAAFCARDRIGARPFVWHWDGARFAFASDVAPIFDLPWVEPRIDMATIAEYLAADLRSVESTVWRDIRRVAPGHRMIVDGRGPRSEPYWRLDLRRRLRYRREEEYADHYREVLTDSVRRLSRAHRPVAFEVSGGLDSSALFAVGHELERSGRLPAPGLSGYTMRLEDEHGANDLPYARDVAAHLGRAMHEIDPTYYPLDWYFAEARRRRTLPPYPNTAISNGLWKAIGDSGTRVVIGGLGGDEVLSGTRSHHADSAVHGEFAGLLDAVRDDIRDLGPAGAIRSLLRGIAYPFLPAAVRRLMRRITGRDSWSGRSWLVPGIAAELDRMPAAPPSPLTGLRYHNQRLALSMVWGAFVPHAYELQERSLAEMALEFRYPFLDARVIAFMASVPERLLRSGMSNRHLHRVAFRGALPASVLDRQDKAAFGAVYQPLIEEIAGRLEQGDHCAWVDPRRVPDVLQAARAGELPLPMRQIWPLLLFEALSELAVIRSVPSPCSSGQRALADGERP